MNLILFLTAAAHMLYAPFTKVEESFNLQAMHDILYLRHNFSQYDHHDFPGVVPRTFLGPLVVSILSSPFVLLFDALNMNKFWAQYVVRLMLAAVITMAWNNLRQVVGKIFDGEVRMWFTMITLTQFHFIFYMTRPLPNIMALPLVLYAVAFWLRGHSKHFIILSGIAIIIFRSELVIFLGLLLVFDFIQRKISVENFLKVALPAGLIILLTTTLVDSFFWQRFLWPEGEVLWYNTILNKSSNWGTSPFLWYFYSAMPRAMGASILFVPIGLYLEPRLRAVVLAAIGFVLIYSVLPHKELRFIIYIFPILNISVACACNRLWINSAKSAWQGFLAFCAGGHLLINIFITIFLLVVSGTNYPGGVALTRLHQIEANSTAVRVHISNLAAQSGVSRFLQMRDDWAYSKDEHLNYTREETVKFTHLLVEAKNKQNNDLWFELLEDFEVMEFVDCFSSIGIQYNSILPVRIKTKPCIAILKRRNEVMTTKKKSNKHGKKETTKAQLEKETESVKVDEELNNLKYPKKIKEYKEPKADEMRNNDKKKKRNKKNDEIKIVDNAVENVVKSDAVESVEIVSPKADEFVESILSDELRETNNFAKQEIEINNAAADQMHSLEDGIVENVDEQSTEEFAKEEHQDTYSGINKEINFNELRNLAMGQVTKKTKATKLKIRKIIEEFYRSKGQQIENDSIEKMTSEKRNAGASPSGPKQTVKAIIKQERIKEMIEQIATMDLTRVCDLEKVSTKDCLKQVIDRIDADDRPIQ